MGNPAEADIAARRSIGHGQFHGEHLRTLAAQIIDCVHTNSLTRCAGRKDQGIRYRRIVLARLRRPVSGAVDDSHRLGVHLVERHRKDEAVAFGAWRGTTDIDLDLTCFVDQAKDGTACNVQGRAADRIGER